MASAAFPRWGTYRAGRRRLDQGQRDPFSRQRGKGKHDLLKGGVIMKSLMRWDPFRMIRRFDPIDELRTMQSEMDRLFDRFMGGEVPGEFEHGQWHPLIESYTKDGKLFIKAELPGIDPKDLDVSVTERELVITGERKTETDERKKDYSYREISYGSFERRLVLPEGAKIEELKAKFTNGILEITVPVPEVPKAKKIAIETKDVKQIESEPKVKKAA
jgi:HSP20 family protein